MTKIDYISPADLLKEVGIIQQQLSYYVVKKVLIENEHYIREGKNKIIYFKSAVKKLKEWRSGKKKAK